MARIESYLLKPIDLTVHRVRGVLQGDDLRRTGKRFYAQEVTLNVLWDFSGADLTQIPSEEFIEIIGEVKAYAHSREGGRTAFVLTVDVNFGLGRMVEMASESMGMPFEFRSFRSLDQATTWLGIDSAAIRALFRDEPHQRHQLTITEKDVSCDGSIITDQPRMAGLEQPIYFWRPSTAVCGLNFYTGDMFPFWKGGLLAANLKFRDLRLLTLADDRVLHEEIILKDFGRAREAVCGPDGAVYAVVNDPDEILRISARGRTAR